MSARSLCVYSTFLVAAALAAGAGHPPGGADATTPNPAVVEKQLVAADKFAREVAGDNEVEYQRLMKAALKNLRAGKGRAVAAAEPGATHAPVASPFAEARVRAQAKAAAQASIFNDPTWKANAKKLAEDVAKRKGPLARIFGGQPTADGEFPDCVAVGAPGQFCCTGTLIAPNLVLTAGHCGDGGCASRVYVGTNANSPDLSKIVNVKKAIIHPQYNPITLENDLTLLILEKDIPNVVPRKIADSKDIDAAYFVRLAGFGFTEFGVFGVQHKVDVAIATALCDCADCPGKYGCHKGKEMVAGGGGLDSCNGDSGGPAYIVKDGQLYLAGATSRATANSVLNCGDGGVYVRVDKYRDWIAATAKENGVKFE